MVVLSFVLVLVRVEMVAFDFYRSWLGVGMIGNGGCGMCVCFSCSGWLRLGISRLVSVFF